MAAAEARTVFQRTNRYLIQEDARRAPKLSAPSSTRSQSDSKPTSATNSSERTGPVGMTRILNPDIQSDTKWWLHIQPNFACQKDYIYEQLNSLEAELEVMSGSRKPIRKFDSQMNTSTSSFSEQPVKISAACFRNGQDARMRELKTILCNSNNDLKKPFKNKEMDEFWCLDDHLMDLDSFTRSMVPKQPDKSSLDLESPWMGVTRNEPWWRTADKDELVSLVAQKSHEHIENCDLPRPQAKHFKRGPCASREYMSHAGVQSSYIDKTSIMGLSAVSSLTTTTTMSMGSKQSTLADVEESADVSDGSYRSCKAKSISLGDASRPAAILNKLTYSTKWEVDSAGTQMVSDNDTSKAQLLEALCHSQTRARQAEEAAKQAYTEKEHIVKLLFKQASQLFAYKQWLQLLQLENLCLQFRNKNQPISTLFPDAFPWNPDKGCEPKKSRLKGAKRKRSPPACEITRCAIAFAVGLSLASAGLLLGWTMGWLFPSSS